MKIGHFFVGAVRSDGSEYVLLTDDAPDWLKDAVREAHDFELPDDWRYATAAAIAVSLDEALDEEGVDGWGWDGWDDWVMSTAEALVDVYNTDLARWLAGDVRRGEYVDRSIDEFGATDVGADVFRSIRVGQFYCIEEMARVLLAAWGAVTGAGATVGR